jgi:hypothetical protein
VESDEREEDILVKLKASLKTMAKKNSHHGD